MQSIIFVLLNVSWYSIFVVVYLMLLGAVVYHNNKGFAVLVDTASKEKYSDSKLCEKINEYIKKHPFSFYNSDLRVKLIPSLLALEDVEGVRNAVRKIRMADVNDQLLSNVIYVLFLLRESGMDEEFSILWSSSSKYLSVKNPEWYTFFDNGFDDSSLLQSDYTNVYLQGIKYYYMGMDLMKEGHLTESKQMFSKAFEVIQERSFYQLLLAKGYKQ